IDVTLIEPLKNFTTCFFSNLYVGGFRDLKSLRHNYDKVRNGGVNVVPVMASSIDRDRKQVWLAGGSRVPYDRLVVAPGIDLKWDSVPGYSEAAAQIMPHAWKPGAQTELLVKKLNALKDGDQIVMVAPPNPFRCPPGPYERASMFAHVLKKKGYKKSRNRHHRSKAYLLQASDIYGRLGKALSRRDRMAGSQDAWRHQECRSKDRRDQNRSFHLQSRAGQRHPRANGRQDRARCGARRPIGLLSDRSGIDEVEGRYQYLHRRRCGYPRRYAKI